MVSDLRQPRRGLEQWGRLSASEKILFLQSLCLLPLIKLGLRILPFGRLAQLLDMNRIPDSCDEGARQKAKRVAKMVAIAANHGFVEANCLPRSLTAHWLLRGQGVPSEVRLGG